MRVNPFNPYCGAVAFVLLSCFPNVLADGSYPEPAMEDDGVADEAQVDGPIEAFTEPYADIRMAASEMGVLRHVYVREGDRVEVGQTLASLDDSVLRASLEIAKAGMESEGELVSAQTQLALKQEELEKLTALFSRNHASQQELDRVAGEVRVAAARVTSVKEDLRIRKLEYHRIEAQLQRRQIRSTIEGVVVHIGKDRGEFVSPSDPAVARIVQLNPLKMVFSVPTSRRDDVTAGQKVMLQMGTNHSIASAFVEFVSPTADASSGTFQLKVRLPNDDAQWHSGEKAILLLDPAPRTFEDPKQIAQQTE